MTPKRYAPLTSPIQILADMMFDNEKRKMDSGDGMTMRGQPYEWSPGEYQELSQARRGGGPTLFGKIAERRRRLSTAGINGAAGRTVSLYPATMQQADDAALIKKYPNSPLIADLKRRYGIK